MLNNLNQKILLLKSVSRKYNKCIVSLFAFGILSFHASSPPVMYTREYLNSILCWLDYQYWGFSGELKEFYNNRMEEIQKLNYKSKDEKWSEEKTFSTLGPLIVSFQTDLEQLMQSKKEKAFQIWEDLFYGKPVDEKDFCYLTNIDTMNIINVLCADPSTSGIFNCERLLAIIDKYPVLESSINQRAIQKKMKEVFNLENEFFAYEETIDPNEYQGLPINSRFNPDICLCMSLSALFKKFIKYMTDKRMKESAAQKSDDKKDNTNEEQVESDNPPSAKLDTSKPDAA